MFRGVTLWINGSTDVTVVLVQIKTGDEQREKLQCKKSRWRPDHVTEATRFAPCPPRAFTHCSYRRYDTTVGYDSLHLGCRRESTPPPASSATLPELLPPLKGMFSLLVSARTDAALLSDGEKRTLIGVIKSHHVTEPRGHMQQRLSET
ncbi:hypothetical protein EYF80_000075 [Liparis tanakae]|uniref:Uncharacterized protein n=1 Tax=Liparis tanakae TaxID=230148 RepID=A0A4Z2JJQ5_9TELE|nr:hypothetical protein EYF80_000075 [Liparis tanakae]